MNKALLSSKMTLYGDNQSSLAKAMSLSTSRLNAKINERGGAAFTQTEMTFIIERYGVSVDDAWALFFNNKVS